MPDEKKILYIGLDPCHYQGHGQVTHLPLIQIVPRPLHDPIIYPSLKHFSSYTHILITSKSSVPILADYLSALGFSIEDWGLKKTCAVGQVTALFLKQIGITPFAIAKEETAEGLVEVLKSLDLTSSRLFWPHSSEARPVIKNFLDQESIAYQSCPLYDPQIIHYPTLPKIDSFDEIVFTSPSTVKAFMTHFKHFPSHLKLTAIGPITARYLEELLGGTSQVFLPSS